jgi:prephenate dehydrogenase
MKITIVGLGIIGGSYAKGLSMKGYEVYGVDKDLDTIKYAIENGFIKHGETTPDNLIPIADMVIIGLYPSAIIPFIKDNLSLFKKGQVITDVCGVKTPICYEATSLLKESFFVGSHPMAGR